MIIGITGGIGGGKSLVTQILKEKFNSAVIDTDTLAHEIIEDKFIRDKILKVFGEEIMTGGKIDRKILGNIVFSDEGKLQTLNSIIHPAVEKEVDERITLLKKNHDYIAIETALLIKVGYNTKCDKIWYVYADKEIRLQRLIESRNLTREKVLKIFKSQNTEEEFKQIADDIIDNSDSKEYVELQIKNILESYKGGYNARIT